MRTYGIIMGTFFAAVGALYGLSCLTGDGVCFAAIGVGDAPVRSVAVGVEEFREAIAGGAILLDVRTPKEYREGHIEGSMLIDWNDPTFREKIATLDPKKPYVLYCRSGNRSASARKAMTSMGFTDVRDLAGGINAWQRAGNPVSPGM
jgi:rhodanese-related sulfurtransferase